MHLANASIASSGVSEAAGPPEPCGDALASGSSRDATPLGAAAAPLQAARTSVTRRSRSEAANGRRGRAEGGADEGIIGSDLRVA
jgi:hypothetical protein